MVLVGLMMATLPAGLQVLTGGNVQLALYGGLLAAPVMMLLLLARVHLAAWLRVRRHPEAYPETPQTLEADERGLRIYSATNRSELTWSGFRGVDVSRRVLVLRVSDLHGVMVPRSAFADADAVHAFAELVRERLERGEDAALQDPPPHGFDLLHATWTPEATEWVVLSQYVARAWFRRLRWLRVAVLGLLALVLGLLTVLSLVGATTLGPRALLAPAVLWVGALVLFTLPLWWVHLLVPWSVRRGVARGSGRYPQGPVALAVGSEGLWSCSSRGVSTLSWAQVSGVEHVDGHTLFLIGERLGIVVPDRVVGDQERALHLREQAARWLTD